MFFFGRYKLMLNCWAWDSDTRPKFAEIRHRLDEIFGKNSLFTGLVFFVAVDLWIKKLIFFRDTVKLHVDQWLQRWQRSKCIWWFQRKTTVSKCARWPWHRQTTTDVTTTTTTIWPDRSEGQVEETVRFLRSKDIGFMTGQSQQRVEWTFGQTSVTWKILQLPTHVIQLPTMCWVPREAASVELC